MLNYTINNKHSDVNWNFAITAEFLGIADKEHIHEIADISGLQYILNGKAIAGHTHTAVLSISSGANKLIGGITFASDLMVITTNDHTLVFSYEIPEGDPITVAKATINQKNHQYVSFYTGDNDTHYDRRQSLSNTAVTGLLDKRQLCISDKRLTRPVIGAFVYQNGEIKNVNKIFSKTAGVDTSLYPLPATRKIRIQTSLDTGGSYINTDGEQYKIPVVGINDTSMQVNVVVEPPNSQWYLVAENFPASTIGPNVIFTGNQTIDLPLEPLEGVGTFLCQLHARPVGWQAGDIQSTTKFQRSKYSTSELVPKYWWPMEQSLDEVKLGAPTVYGGEGESPSYGYDTFAVSGHSFGPSMVYDTAPAITGAKATGVNIDPRVNGASLSFFFKRTMGLDQQYDVGLDSTQSCFYARVSYGIVNCYFLRDWYNTTDKKAPNKIWNHIAITMSRILTEDDVPADVWAATASNQYVFRGKTYLNGVLIKEQYVRFYKGQEDQLAALGQGNMYIGRTSANRKEDNGQYVDEVKLFDYELSLGDIRSEAALAGYSFGGDGDDGGETTPPKEPEKFDTPRARENPPADLDAVRLEADLKVFVIDNQTIAIGGHFQKFYEERLHTEYNRTVPNMEFNYRQGYRAKYKHSYYYQFSLAELQKDYEPRIIDKYDSDNYFKCNGATTTWLSAWSNACGLLYVKDAYDQTKNIKVAIGDIAHFAYVRLNEPMVEGQEYTITDGDDNTTTFTYSRNHPVSSIKVNQIGYVPNVDTKYAYLGQWMGASGSHTFTNGMTFHLIDSAGNTVYTGTMVLRTTSDTATASGGKVFKLTGEQTYEMNFGDFRTVGEYQIYIPGVGYSHKFKISNDAIGEIHYTHARGLYHQRSGIGKELPYTKWPAAESQKQTYEALFWPNNYDYWSFLAEDGSNWGDTYGTEAFGMIEKTKTTKVLRDVYGGWWDAADWDRREYHLWAVHDLCHAYLLFPTKHSDNQFNIPESGDGIPDILSEAIWGMNVWRMAQGADGGVGCWIESTTHPQQPDSAMVNDNPFYLAHPTGYSSYFYASAAAMLAQALQKVGTPAALEQADLFLDSAIRAFAYANQPVVRKAYDIMINGSPVTFYQKEFADRRTMFRLWAAVALYKASGRSKYSKCIADADIVNPEGGMSDWESYRRMVTDDSFAYNMMIDLCDLTDEFPVLANRMKDLIIQRADRWLNNQSQQTYRNMAYPPTSAYFHFNGWGNCHSATRGNLFVYAYYLTGDKKYYNAAACALDWMCGANPQGRTMTTGLGKIYPVRILSKIDEHVRSTTGVGDPTPGITYYGYQRGMNGNAVVYVYGLFITARSDEAFNGASLCLLPGRNRNIVAPNRGTIAVWLEKNSPIWHSSIDLQDYSVDNSEFTIWETISRQVLMTSMLLSEGWTPSQALLDKAPIADEEDIPGFVHLP